MYKFSARILFAFILFTPAFSHADPFRVRVMTYNCGSATYLDLSPFGIQRIADEIIDNRVDLAGLTEMDLGTSWFDGRDLVAEVRVALAERGYPMHVFQTTIVPYKGGWVVHGFLSRWPIKKWEQPEIDAWRGWFIDHITIEPVPGLVIEGYNTHFPVGLNGREPEVEQCFDIVNETDHPRFFMGDLNLGYSDWLLGFARERDLHHTCQVANGAMCLSVGRGGAAVVAPTPLTGQIDHIFASGNVRVVRSYTHFTSISDHWPVIAELEFDAPGTITNPDNARLPSPIMPWDAAMEEYRIGNYETAAIILHALADQTSDERTDFILYSAGCMELLAGKPEKAEETFALCVEKHPNEYWGVRAIQRLSLIHDEQGRFEDAYRENERFLLGYYEIVHPYPLDNTLWGALEPFMRYRNAMQKPASDTEILNELIADHEGTGLAEAAHYILSRRFLNTDPKAWYEHFSRANVPLDKLFNDSRMQRQIAIALARNGDATGGDYVMYEVVTQGDLSSSNHRSALGPYWKVRYPGEYGIHLRPDMPVTVDLSGPRHVVNRLNHPDPPSGTLSLLLGGEKLTVSVTVRDATHSTPYEGEGMWRGDCLQIAIDPGPDGGGTYDANDSEFGVARIENGTVIHVWKAGEGSALDGIQADVQREEEITRYEVSIPIAGLGAQSGRFGMNVLVNDNDGGGRTAWLEWTPGIADEKTPGMFPDLVLEE